MRRLRPLLLPAAIVALMVAVALWIGARQVRRDPVRDHSVMRANEWGTKALAELCRGKGLKVSPWSRPLTLLTERQKVLCLFDPSRQPTAWELDKLAEWVRDGGVLIIGAHMEEDDNLLQRWDDAGPDERVGGEGRRHEYRDLEAPRLRDRRGQPDLCARASPPPCAAAG